MAVSPGVPLLTVVQQQQLLDAGIPSGHAATFLGKHGDFTRLLALARYGADLPAAASLLADGVDFESQLLPWVSRGLELRSRYGGPLLEWEALPGQGKGLAAERDHADGDGLVEAQELEELHGYGLRGRDMRAALRLRHLGLSQGQVVHMLDCGSQMECAVRCLQMGMATGQLVDLSAAGVDLGGVSLLLEEVDAVEDVFHLVMRGVDPWLLFEYVEAGGSVSQAWEMVENGYSLLDEARRLQDGMAPGHVPAHRTVPPDEVEEMPASLARSVRVTAPSHAVREPADIAPSRVGR